MNERIDKNINEKPFEININDCSFHFVSFRKRTKVFIILLSLTFWVDWATWATLAPIFFGTKQTHGKLYEFVLTSNDCLELTRIINELFGFGRWEAFRWHRKIAEDSGWWEDSWLLTGNYERTEVRNISPTTRRAMEFKSSHLPVEFSFGHHRKPTTTNKCTNAGIKLKKNCSKNIYLKS